MTRIATLAVALALIIPSTAWASDSSTCQAYSPKVCAVVSATNNSRGSGPQATSSSLPFTGLDVALLAAGGATLIGAGLIFRRLAAPPDDSERLSL